MTCCTPSRVANSTGGPAVVQPPHPSSPTPVGSENRARFGAAKTFVGTAGPVIPEDGEAIRRVTLRAFELELTTVTNARFSDYDPVGNRVPDHRQYAIASFHDTCTTG